MVIIWLMIVNIWNSPPLWKIWWFFMVPLFWMIWEYPYFRKPSLSPTFPKWEIHIYIYTCIIWYIYIYILYIPYSTSIYSQCINIRVYIYMLLHVKSLISFLFLFKYTSYDFRYSGPLDALRQLSENLVTSAIFGSPCVNFARFNREFNECSEGVTYCF